MVIWLVGLSGSGKTTIGKLVYEKLKKNNPATVFLDGDILREVWGENVGYDIEGRRLNAHRISHLCKVLDAQGINVVAAVLSIFNDWQQWNRDNFSDYIQIFLDTPIEDLIKRDTKGIYSKAIKGHTMNVVGVDIPFPKPLHSDLVIETSGKHGGPDVVVKKIFNYLSIDAD